MSEKSRMTITQYRVANKRTTIVDAMSFKVMLNPADVKHSRSLTYDKKKSQGQTAQEPRFASVGDETIGFALVLDGTGAVPLMAGETRRDVKTQIEDLNKVVYKLVGAIHEPSHVRLLWGTLIFFGRLQSMSTHYTLFKPGGEPLRAKLDLSFLGAMSKDEAQLQSNMSSPDLTHVIEVRDGDSLPLLCNRIYGDPGYYLDVARHNQLADFRQLRAGSKLYFPPLA